MRRHTRSIRSSAIRETLHWLDTCRLEGSTLEEISRKLEFVYDYMRRQQQHEADSCMDAIIHLFDKPNEKVRSEALRFAWTIVDGMPGFAKKDSLFDAALRHLDDVDGRAKDMTFRLACSLAEKNANVRGRFKKKIEGIGDPKLRERAERELPRLFDERRNADSALPRKNSTRGACSNQEPEAKGSPFKDSEARSKINRAFDEAIGLAGDLLPADAQIRAIYEATKMKLMEDQLGIIKAAFHYLKRLCNERSTKKMAEEFKAKLEKDIETLLRLQGIGADGKPVFDRDAKGRTGMMKRIGDRVGGGAFVSPGKDGATVITQIPKPAGRGTIRN